MYKHHKLDQVALKNLIHNNISPIDSNNKTKLIIYYPKFNITNLISLN